jgi:type II secretory pathway pseudopilin PulG
MPSPLRVYRSHKSAAFTLVELLVASTIALVVMGALASLFGIFSRTATSTQAIVDLMNRMRITQRQLRDDLSGVTCRPVPPVNPDSGTGYFELIEGPQTDSGKPWRSDVSYAIGDRVAFNGVSWVAIAAGSNNQPDLTPAAWSRETPLTADIDDILLFTTRKSGSPFDGKYVCTEDLNANGMLDAGEDQINIPANVIDPFPFNTIESSDAELTWYCSPAPTAAQSITGVTLYNLYRRQRIVLPYLGIFPFARVAPSGQGTSIQPPGDNGRPNTISSSTTGLTAAAWQGIYNGFLSSNFLCDLSLRREDAGGNFFLLPNSLSDLTRRENRFWRHRTAAPFTVNPFPHPLQTSGTVAFDGTTREGEDLMLTNVLAFDVRVFDPEAPIHNVNGMAVAPGDPGYPVQVDPTAVVNLPADLPGSAATGTMYQVRSTGRFYARLASGWQLLPLGAYVDLGWGIPVPNSTGANLFSAPPAAPFPMLGANPFPGSEDINGNGTLEGTEDTNANGRIDRFTPFQGFGMRASNVPANAMMPTLTYDTWSTHYESNGLDEDGDGLVDEGTDGIDQPTIDTNNDGILEPDGIPDDPAERETSPPYPVPLRGIEVRIRCIEPTTKEIRQITIRHAFQ